MYNARRRRGSTPLEVNPPSGGMLMSKDVRFLTGFTLVEVLVVISLLAILAGFGLFVSFDFYRGYSFRSERNIIVSVLSKAREESLSNMDQSPHGVYFSGSNYVIFEGTSYMSRIASLDEVIPKRNPNATIAGLAEVVFAQLTGDPNVTGTVSIISGARMAEISINDEGRIDW